MSQTNANFPPPLKEALASDTTARGNPAVVVYRTQFPWELYPPGSSVVVVVGGENQNVPPPPPNDLPAGEDNNYRVERRDLSYLNYILASWQRGVVQVGASNPERAFPTYSQVAAMNAPTHIFIPYEHAGVKWRSSYRVKIEGATSKLIVHLANDGFLYFNPADVEIDTVGNDRHKKTCPSGWKVFKQGAVADGVKTKLADFKAFAVAWFGTDAIRQSVLYNPTGWRIDICFQHKDTNVGLEFSFEPDWPVPAEDYWCLCAESKYQCASLLGCKAQTDGWHPYSQTMQQQRP